MMAGTWNLRLEQEILNEINFRIVEYDSAGWSGGPTEDGFKT